MFANLGSALDAPSDEWFLWPDCVDAFECWLGAQTQWRAGMSGATGLDYAGLGALLDERDLARGSPERREIFECLQAAERATLDVWREQRELDEQRQAAQHPRPPGH